MTDYDNTNTGVLFKNDTAGKSDKFPGYGGSTEQQCPHCNKTFLSWVSAWVKDGKKGKFFSLAFKPKDAEPAEARPVAPATEWADEDVPF